MSDATVMIVDDSSTIRMLVTYTLTELGYQVVKASGGIDALDKLKTTSVDVIITDLNMPGMNGMEMIRRVRQLPDHQSTPIVLLTTESGQSSRQQGRDLGANAWMVKPFQQEQLGDVLKTLLQKVAVN